MTKLALSPVHPRDPQRAAFGLAAPVPQLPSASAKPALLALARMLACRAAAEAAGIKATATTKETIR
jgi:hypothetical protein